MDAEGGDTLLVLKIAVPVGTLSLVILIMCTSFAVFFAYVKVQQRSKCDLRAETYKALNHSGMHISLESNIAYMAPGMEASTQFNSPVSEAAEPLPTDSQDYDEYDEYYASDMYNLTHSSQQAYHTYDYIDSQ